MLPWGLYNLTPRDQASPLMRPFFKTVTQDTPLTVTTAEAVNFIPEDSMLLVSLLSMRSVSDAGGQVRFQDIQILGPTNVIAEIHHHAPAGFLWFTSNTGQAPLMILHPYNRIHFRSQLGSVPVSSHSVEASIIGYTVPRGTFGLT